MYDKGLYLEPDCVNGASPMPVHCNYMGLGQECRGCFMDKEIAVVRGDRGGMCFCPLAEEIE
ncbi:unnamed protein product [Ectocarpus sp. CCAP 1310/34]|nr:unnamed protein product [Ectocarpus sp. CCAP 1310/34]